MRWIFGAVGLFALWLAMSGVYKPLIIGLGAASAIVASWIVWRMEQACENARIQSHQKIISTVLYFFWLLKEIAKSNWAVTKAIMSPEMPIRQHFFEVPFSQKSFVAQAIFGNSITLTPGTITVEVEDGHFLVHAVQFGEGDLDALADMDTRVAATEAV